MRRYSAENGEEPIWVLASLLLGHRPIESMLPRRAWPETKTGATQVSKILCHSTSVVSLK